MYTISGICEGYSLSPFSDTPIVPEPSHTCFQPVFPVGLGVWTVYSGHRHHINSCSLQSLKPRLKRSRYHLAVMDVTCTSTSTHTICTWYIR